MKHKFNILHGLPYLSIMTMLISAVTHGHATERPGYLVVCAGPVDQLEKPVIRRLAGLLADNARIFAAIMALVRPSTLAFARPRKRRGASPARMDSGL